MNDMLERVEMATRRQRQFVADASHELRSPLTRMRAELEVDLVHPAGADPWETHESVLEEVIGLERLVDDLLLLARNEAVDSRVARRDDTVDVATMVTGIADGLGRRGHLSIDAADKVMRVQGSSAELARAIGNLVDNATRHARSIVRLLVSSTGPGSMSVTVEDDGPGVPAADRERVFERFTRLDESRSASAGGTGLGLAIARDIVDRHGGTISVDTAPAGGARFTVTLPASST